MKECPFCTKRRGQNKIKVVSDPIPQVPSGMRKEDSRKARKVSYSPPDV